MTPSPPLARGICENMNNCVSMEKNLRRLTARWRKRWWLNFRSQSTNKEKMRMTTNFLFCRLPPL